MANRLAKCCAIRILVAAAFVAATMHSCHHEHLENPAGLSASDTQITAESCGCGHSHQTGDDDHHHCSCVCHIPSALFTSLRPVFDPPAVEWVTPVLAMNGFDHVDRVERPPRLA